MPSRLCRAASWAAASVCLAAAAIAAAPPDAGRAATPGSPLAVSAAAADATQPLVSDVPAERTPQVQGDSVHAYLRMGDRMIVGGRFDAVIGGDEDSPTVARSNLFAFDVETGEIDPGFHPQLDGEVDALAAGPDGASVFVGGQFHRLGTAAHRGLVRLDLATGALTRGFAQPVLDGSVRALALSGSRLILGGVFKNVDGEPHAGLATLDASDGALDPYMSVQLTGHHNWTPGSSTPPGSVGVWSFAMAPDGRSLVAVGNFKEADGVVHDQIVRVLLGSRTATVDSWNTATYTYACSYTHFDGYVRGVAYSPDGSYFVVVSTGGSHKSMYCDTAVRFDSASTGTSVAPAWVARTGGDSLYSVAIGADVVYVGGHQRWLDNPNGGDGAGAGAVPRPGIAALDPLTGLPLRWNPGRNPRGEGAWVLYLEPAGLWVGSDTNCIGPSEPGFCTTYERDRVAFFPAGGAVPAAVATTDLPADVVSLGRYAPDGLGYGDGATATAFTGRTAAPDPTPRVDDGTTWSAVRGAVRVGPDVYYGWADGTLRARSYVDGQWGPERLVDPYNDPVWSDIRTGSDDRDGNPIYYRGKVTSFYAEIPGLTTLFYRNGRLYYTLAGSPSLFWRAFLPDSGIVSPQRHAVSRGGVDWSGAAGAFFAGDTLYWAAAADGTLHAITFSVTGVPVAGTDRVLSGPGIDGTDWRARGMFVAPTSPAPVTGLAATLDGGRVTLRWDAPPAGLDVVVHRKDGTVPPASVDAWDGATVVTDCTVSGCVDSELTLGATYSYSVWVKSGDGDLSTLTFSAPAQLTLTTTNAPRLTTPAIVASVSRTPVFTVRWTPAADGPAPVSYDVQWRVIGGRWTSWLSQTTATSATFGGGDQPVKPVAGKSYLFRVSARDRYGNPTVVTGAMSTEPYNDTVAKATTSGWRTVASSSAWLGEVRSTKTRSARLVATLSGCRFVVVGTKTTGTGQFKVYLDGVSQATVGTQGARTLVRQLLWTSKTVPPGRHRIDIVNVATSGHPAVMIDGIAAVPATSG